MQEIVDLFMNNSVTIAVLIYFIYRDNKFMTKLELTLNTLVNTVNALKVSVKAHACEITEESEDYYGT